MVGGESYGQRVSYQITLSLLSPPYLLTVNMAGEGYEITMKHCFDCGKQLSKNKYRRCLVCFNSRISRGLFTKQERRDRITASRQKWIDNNREKYQMTRSSARILRKYRDKLLKPINSTEWIAKVSMLQNKCQTCLKTEPEVKITIDHIIPISRGGTNEINNLQPLCMSCNRLKGVRVSSNSVTLASQ